MNFFGIGVLELAVIFLIAFLVMGPAKTIEMARSAGKLIGDLRRTVNDMTAAADLSGLGRLDQSPPTGPTRSGPSTSSQPTDAPPAGAVPTTGLVQEHAETASEEGNSANNTQGSSPQGSSPQDSAAGEGNEQRP